jgi:hypothetical protein
LMNTRFPLVSIYDTIWARVGIAHMARIPNKIATEFESVRVIFWRAPWVNFMRFPDSRVASVQFWEGSKFLLPVSGQTSILDPFLLAAGSRLRLHP